MTSRSLRFLIAATLTAASFAAAANVSVFSDRSSFSAQGLIVENYGFEDLNTASGGGLLFPGDSWTTHGVIYNTGSNLVIGPAFGLGFSGNVFTSNSSQAGGLVSGSIGSPLNQFSLFGFDLGRLLGTLPGTVPVTIALQTNLGSYSFSDRLAPQMPATSFVGFKSGAGEYFTGFSISNAADGVPGIDNVTLGVASISQPIPEPGVVGMLLAGLSLLGFVRRRKANSL